MRKKKAPSLFQSVVKALSDSFNENQRKTSIERPIIPLSRNKCKFWNCNRSIRPGHFLCPEHYEGWQDYEIDKCPKCGRYKDEEYDMCLDCRRKTSTARNSRIQKTPNSNYRVEHSDKWRNQNKGDSKFFVYILKFTDGKYYVGHTDNLRVRLAEHRDGKTRSTANKKFDMQYYEIFNNRKDAELKEVELKILKDNNERKLRQIILDFQDIQRELN